MHTFLLVWCIISFVIFRWLGNDDSIGAPLVITNPTSPPDVGWGLNKMNVRLRNRSDSLLVIQYLQSSCSCLGAASSKDVVKPGEEFDLVFNWNTNGLSGYSRTYLTLVYNSGVGDTRAGNVRIPIEANVTPVATLSPPAPSFDSSSGDYEVVKIKSNCKMPANFVSVSSPHPAIVTSISDSKQSFEVT
jgi:hypothetical protein